MEVDFNLSQVASSSEFTRTFESTLTTLKVSSALHTLAACQFTLSAFINYVFPTLEVTCSLRPYWRVSTKKVELSYFFNRGFEFHMTVRSEEVDLSITCTCDI